MLTIHVPTAELAFNRDGLAEKLIDQMAHKDTSAMGELYQLIGTDVYAYALSKTANKEDSEDITHDTFVQVWKSAASYKPIGKPLAWIFTIEMNLIRKQFRRKHKVVPFDEAVKSEEADEDFTEDIINSELIRQIIRILKEDEREIISLHVVSGLKHREIARLLKKPLSTVLSKYNRAIKKLQIQITEKEGR